MKYVIYFGSWIGLNIAVFAIGLFLRNQGGSGDIIEFLTEAVLVIDLLFLVFIAYQLYQVLFPYEENKKR